MTATVDVAIDTLVDLFTGVIADGWQVIDTGPPIDPMLDWLCVGFDFSDQQPVAVDFGDMKAGALRRRASYEIASTLSKWDGTEGPRAVRDEMLTVFYVIRAAVLADRTLGGLVTDAVIPDCQFRQDASPVGAAMTLTFTTHIDAF